MVLVGAKVLTFVYFLSRSSGTVSRLRLLRLGNRKLPASRYRDLLEVYVRCIRLQLYSESEYGTIILVIAEAPTVIEVGGAL